MGNNLIAAAEFGKTLGAAVVRPAHDFEQQCLRILRCTARALANSPGGLRFKAGTQPWLDALCDLGGDMSTAVHQGR